VNTTIKYVEHDALLQSQGKRILCSSWKPSSLPEFIHISNTFASATIITLMPSSIEDWMIFQSILSLEVACPMKLVVYVPNRNTVSEVLRIPSMFGE
jgi:hypothetical protein